MNFINVKTSQIYEKNETFYIGEHKSPDIKNFESYETDHDYFVFDNLVGIS